jgi:hypothetical protein
MENELVYQDNHIPQGVQMAMIKANQAINKFETTKSTIISSVDKIGEIVMQVKEIDYAIKQMDSQVELMLIDYDMRIEKYKIATPVLQNQLTNYSNQMDTLLKEILKMDAYSNDINYIRYRSELISTLRGTSETLSNMFIKFITL